MTSKLKIDTLETLDGTGTIALNNQLSGMTSDSMPAGSVVQVQEIQIEATEASTTSTSYVNSGLAFTYSPKHEGSKLRIEVNINVDTGQTDNKIELTILRNGSNTTTLGSFDGFARVHPVGVGRLLFNQSFSVVDNSASSSHTYAIGFRASGGNTVRLRSDIVPAVITLTEIKQ